MDNSSPTEAPTAGPRETFAFRVNGADVTVETWPMKRLLDVLREDLGLTGTKEGCGEGECGACSVFIDDALVNACLVPVAQVVGADILTIEGVQGDARLHPVQTAFVEEGGAQCGICTPGMIMAAVALLREHPQPTREQIALALAGNLCRCTGYTRIVTAVERAANLLAAEETS